MRTKGHFLFNLYTSIILFLVSKFNNTLTFYYKFIIKSNVFIFFKEY